MDLYFSWNQRPVIHSSYYWWSLKWREDRDNRTHVMTISDKRTDESLSHTFTDKLLQNGMEVAFSHMERAARSICEQLEKSYRDELALGIDRLLEKDLTAPAAVLQATLEMPPAYEGHGILSWRQGELMHYGHAQHCCEESEIKITPF